MNAILIDIIMTEGIQILFLLLICICGIKNCSQHGDQQDQIKEELYSRTKMDPHQSKVNSHDWTVSFIIGCQAQTPNWKWVKSEGAQLIQQCQVGQYSEAVQRIYQSLAQTSADFGSKHISIMIKHMKQYPQTNTLLGCLLEYYPGQKYFSERKKYKYLSQFLSQFPEAGKQMFSNSGPPALYGRRICKFLRSLFDFYNLAARSDTDSLSTQFVRAFLQAAQIFRVTDLANCLTADTSGKILQLLDQLAITNIFVRIPELFQTCRHIRLRNNCQTGQLLAQLASIRERFEGIDMFKVMLNDYDPFVTIAAETNADRQVRLLAAKFADVFNHRDKYIELIMQEL